MSKRKAISANSEDFLTIEALKTEGLYFSHKSGRFFEVKLAKKKMLGFPMVKMKLDDGESRTVVFFHINFILEQGIYESIIPAGDL